MPVTFCTTYLNHTLTYIKFSSCNYPIIMYYILMPILMRDMILPVLISSLYWLSFYYGILLMNMFVFVIISIAYVYYCKWVNANYEYFFSKESVDEKLNHMSSISRKIITGIWVSHFAFFFFGGISLGVSVPFIIYFNL